jgi:pilus assembly protein CpaE
LSEVPRKLSFLGVGERGRAAGPKPAKVGVMDGALGAPERLASLSAFFPQVEFESAGAVWPEARASKFNILIVAVEARSAADVEQALHRLRERAPTLQVVVVLRDADVATTRRLLREGVADVLPAPVGEPTLAVSIERLLHADPALKSGAPKSGQLVAFLKAGGGVGATALAVQIAALLAYRAPGQVCLADLDLQFGAAALYLDMPEALTIADVVSAGSALQETPFVTALATHRSGARILAAPREITPLEALAPQQADVLVAGLKRDFALTLVELPSVWTAWTNRVLQLADRIVLVTHLSVPHMQLVKRQLRIMTSQGLDDQSLTLVVNAVTSEHLAQVSIKAAERAIGRSFDAILPEDRRSMNMAINQGLELAAVRRGTKLEKVIAELANRIGAGALAQLEASGAV